MFFKDFASGAMIENIVRRAKKLAIKRHLAEGPKGIRLADMIEAIHQEDKEHEDLPNTTNPGDWAKTSGKKGERISCVRTIVNRDDGSATGGRSIERVATGKNLWGGDRGVSPRPRKAASSSSSSWAASSSWAGRSPTWP